MMKLVVASFLAICFVSKLVESIDEDNVQDIENSPPSEGFDHAQSPYDEGEERKFDISAYFPDYYIPVPENVIVQSDNYAQCILERHNFYRESVGLQPLKWNDHLASLAFDTSNYFS